MNKESNIFESNSSTVQTLQAALFTAKLQNMLEPVFDQSIVTMHLTTNFKEEWIYSLPKENFGMKI